MSTFIKLFVVLTLVTCFIAYWSDNLGKKLGKKRITFAGFRPRQTATAITMASSWSIMLVTLLALMLVDRNTRWALLHFDSINDRNQQLQAQTPLLVASNQRLGQKNKALEQQNKISEQQKARDQKLLAADNAQLVDKQSHLAETKQQLGKKQQEVNHKQQELEQKQQEVGYKQQQLDQRQQELGQKQQQLKQINTQLSSTKASLAQVKHALITVNYALTTVQRNLLVVKRTNLDTLNNNNALIQQKATLEQELKQKQATVSNLEEQRKTLDAKVGDLQAKAAEWRSNWYRTVSERDELASLAPLANGNILVTVNQVFAAQTISANSSSSEALAALRQLLANGNDMVKKPPISGQELRLVPLNIEAQGQRIQLKEDEIINRLADYISSFEVPASVRLVAAYNQVAGETEIGGRMVVVPVRPAVSSGDVISAMTIDGAQSDAHIFNQLLALVNEGEKAARGHGVLPPQSPGNPDFYAAGTNERIFEALRRIQAVKGPARVRLLAATDLSTADAAKVRFEVSHFEVSRP